jgi:glutamate dehydrogenase
MSADQKAAEDLDEATARASAPDDFGPGDTPQNDIETFADALFGRVAPEDLKRYLPLELAELAADAFGFLQLRTPGEPKIRIAAAPPSARKELKTTSIIEIINDDMPFLVDSVLGELGERRLDVRLVAHPVLEVTREADGTFVGLGAASDIHPSRRESFMHIHVELIDSAEAREALIQG